MTLLSDFATATLDPTFATRLRSHAAELDKHSRKLSHYQIEIGKEVSDWWAENSHTWAGTQEEYYAQVSAVINESGLLVSDSGRTVRSWVDAVKRYDADTIRALTAEGISMSHMTAAVRLYNAGHVASPLVALTMAVTNRWAADDMVTALTPEPENGWGVLLAAKWLSLRPRFELPTELRAEWDAHVAGLLGVLEKVTT